MLSQAALADLVGVTRVSCSRWEGDGKPYPSVKNLERLAVLLEVRFEWLVTGRGEMECSDSGTVYPFQRTLGKDEQRMLSIFNRLSPQRQSALIDFLNRY